MTKTTRPPTEAAKFAATVSIDRSETDTSALQEKPITIVARTSQEAFQGYWGRCVNDFAGYIPATGPVPIDYNHNTDDTSDVIGVADTLEIVDGNLIAHGRIIPFAPDDTASEVIFKGSSGIPYQASIVLDLTTIEAVEVAAGETVEVNGQPFVGPGYIFTRWGVSGIAILPYGADPNTSVQFARGIPDATLDRDAAVKYKTDFGPQGFDWWLEGKSYEDSARLFTASLRREIDVIRAKHLEELASKDQQISALTVEYDRLKKSSEFHRGQPMPVKNRPTETEEVKPVVAKNTLGRSSSQQALIDSIAAKMPKAGSVNIA